MNTKMLRGLRCPNPLCQSEGPFCIRGKVDMTLNDVRFVETFPPCNLSYEKEDICVCTNCRHKGTVADFEKMTDAERQKYITVLMDQSYSNPRLLRELAEYFVKDRNYWDYYHYMKAKKTKRGNP